MNIFITIVVFLVILFIVIVAHELGHFFVAKLSKVRVEELGLGFPPRIFGIKRGETIYSLNWVPLGGFCKMAGEEDPNVPGSLAAKGRWTRFFVLSAGSVAMLILPAIIFPIAQMVPMERYVDGKGVQVVSVAAGSPAQAADIQVGDIIVSIEGQEVNTIGEVHEAVEPYIGQEMSLVLLRDSAQVEVSLVPRAEYPEGEGSMGVQIGPITEYTAYPPWQAIPRGLAQYWEMLVQIKDALVSLFQGTEALVIAGPIGIAQLTSSALQAGIYPLIWFTCFLSVNLAFINLLPIPALDGGRILFLLIEVLRGGRRIAPQREGLINLIGFSLLIIFILVVSYFDVLRVIQGGSLLP
ncbi:MAG: M50 family metallopeptidase [Chloroflexota bacterium]|nr:M50 family metallopeptidase [Chloroflexota bacterium]